MDGVIKLFSNISSKNKELSKQSVEELRVYAETIDVASELIIFILDKTNSENKPIVISAACDFIRILVKNNNIQDYYYIIIPTISPLCLDIKKTIADSAMECVSCIYNSVVNKDLEYIIPELLNTIKNPQTVESTIDMVSSTKFVTSVTCGTISILCPLLTRGYSIRKDKISRLCSKIVVNMLKLVDNYDDVCNFLPILTPLIKNAIEIVSDPEARQTIEESLKELKMISELKDTNKSIKSQKPNEAVELCNCDFTLAYGNKILLKNTNMTLYKGFKYGLIGESGKSTLLRAISENKVDGFPDIDKVKCVFVETDIIGEKSHLNCIDYVLDDLNISKMGFDSKTVEEELLKFEFGNENINTKSAAKVNSIVTTLSGGWRLKLGLVRAMLVKPDILLLESPTDHLDVLNIEWIQNYIKECNVSVIFTSQSKNTLNMCCTHIIQIKNLKLNIFYGNLESLIKIDKEVEEYFKLDNKSEHSEIIKFRFPEPGMLEGVKSRTKGIIKMENCTFTYTGNTVPTIKDVSIQVSLSSRVGILGPNGVGKSTAIKLLTGENIPQIGTVYKHPNVRVAYLAQHSFNTINLHPNKTPNEYLRWRFEIPGEDRESIKKHSTTLSSLEVEEMKKEYTFNIKDDNDKILKISGVVDSLTGLRKKEKDGTYSYQVKFSGKSDDNNIYIPMVELEKRNEICFKKLISAVDEKIASMSGLYIKPLTRVNVEDHLSMIGLSSELASHTKISQLSDGEKVKVVLAACMWLSPHILIFDEPTNSLSWDSLVALINAIKEFEGGVVIISHNQDFVESVCNESWLMSKDNVTGISKLCVTDKNNVNLKELLIKDKNKLDVDDFYLDANGNQVKIINKKKATKQDIKKLKKKIAALRKAGEEVWTDEEMTKLGLEFTP